MGSIIEIDRFQMKSAPAPRPRCLDIGHALCEICVSSGQFPRLSGPLFRNIGKQLEAMRAWWNSRVLVPALASDSSMEHNLERVSFDVHFPGSERGDWNSILVMSPRPSNPIKMTVDPSTR
jgi:hypothetical protein